MDFICLYTIVNPRTLIKDYTCQSEYAEQKSKQGFIIYANLVQKTPRIYYFHKRG